MEAALADVRDRQGKRVDAVGQVRIGEATDGAGRGGHARPDGGALALMRQAQNSHPVPFDDCVGGSIGAAVVGDDDLAIDPGAVVELRTRSTFCDRYRTLL